MIGYKQWILLQERRYRDMVNDEGHRFYVYINPTIDEVHQLMSGSNELRGFLSDEGNIFIWNSNDEIHNKIAMRLEETMQIPFYIRESNGYLFVQASTWSGRGDVPSMTKTLEGNPKIRAMLGW